MINTIKLEGIHAIRKELKEAFPETKFLVKIINRNSTVSIDILEKFEDFELNGKGYGYHDVVKKIEDTIVQHYRGYKLWDESRIMTDYCNLRLTIIF